MVIKEKIYRSLSLILSDITYKRNLLEQEKNYLKEILDFFTIKKDNWGENLASKIQLEYLLGKLKNYLPVEEEIENLKNKEKMIKNHLFLLKSDLREGKNFYNYGLTYYIIDNISESREIIANIVRKLDFWQKKIFNVLESYYSYYPSPKISSFRESTKKHFFLEEFCEEIMKILFKDKFGKIQFDKIQSLFFWSFFSSINFDKYIQDRNYVLCVSTDYFLPYTRFKWIIFLHEIIHSAISVSRNENLPKMFEDLLKYSDIIRHAISYYLIDTDFSGIVPNSIEDILIDSLLCNVFGVLYLVPIFVELFLLDENSENNQIITRSWFLRLTFASHFCKNDNIKKLFKQEDHLKLDKIKDDIIELLKSLYYVFSSDIRYQNIFSFEEKVFYISERIINKFIKKHSGIFKDLFIIKNNSKLYFIYFDYLCFFYEKLLEKYNELTNKENTIDITNKSFFDIEGEGRYFVFLFYENIFKNYLNKNIDKNQAINQKVISVNYYRIRYDSDKNNNNSDKNIFQIISAKNMAFCIGYYSSLNLFIKEKAEKNNIHIEEGVQYFRETFDLTTFTNIQNLEKNLENINDKILIFVKFKINTSNNNQKVDEIFEKIIEEIKSKIGQCDMIPTFSLEWHDLCYIFIISNNDDKKQINLNQIYNIFFQNFNITLILKPEIEVFIGKDIIENVFLEKFIIKLRLSTRYITNNINQNYSEIIDHVKTKIKNTIREMNVNFCFDQRNIIITSFPINQTAEENTNQENKKQIKQVKVKDLLELFYSNLNIGSSSDSNEGLFSDFVINILL